jgi:plastocyanin
MQSRRNLATAVAAVAARLAAVAHAPAADAPTASAAARPKRSTAVGVGAREFRLAVYRPRVRAGEVRFNLANYGEDAHDLVVRDGSGRVRGRSAEVRPGRRTTLTVRLGRGGYRLSCDVADHAQLGMRASLKVVR